MQPAKKFAFDISLTFMASVTNMALGFVITLMLGRYLGPGDLGLYYMNSTIYGISILFGGIGIPAAVIKYIAENKDDRYISNKVITSGIITSILIGIGFSVFMYLSAGIFENIFKMPGLSGLLRTLSPVYPFSLTGGVLLGILNGRREMKKYAISTILQSILMTGFSVLMVEQGFGVKGVVFSVVLSSAGSCLYLFWVTRNYFDIAFDNYVQTTREILIFGVQIFGTNAINVINYQADTIMIGYFLTATDVGYYGVAVSFTKFFWIIPSAIQTITYPATSEYWKTKNIQALQTMIDKSMKYAALMLIPIGLGVGFFAREIILILFKKGFNNSILPMLILITGTVIYGIIISIGGSISGAGRPDLGVRVVAISAAVNIVLNALFIPYYGISGAAVATLISLSLNAILGLVLTVKILKIKFDASWFIKMAGLTVIWILLFNYFSYLNVYIVGILILLMHALISYSYLVSAEDKKFIKQLLPSIQH